MELQAGRTYRAKAATGEQIGFTVVDVGDGGWCNVDLDSVEGPEPNVMLNTNLLLWISSETRRTVALTKAADEVIEALEKSEETA